MDDTLLDVLKDRKYKNMEPVIVRRDFRIPGTSIKIQAGDRVYYDGENDRLIIEPSKKQDKEDLEGNDG